MNQKTTKNILVLAGGTALVSAVVWSTVGLVLHGNDMTPNLLAELAGVSLEISVVALIVERVMNKQKRREWDFAYRALAERSCEAFVDVMRLIFSRSSEAILNVNLSRYPSFVHLAEQHRGDLRSHIEGSASALDPSTHKQYRRVERRLAWCLGRLQVPTVNVSGDATLLPLLRDTAELLFELLSKDGDDHHPELTVARSSLIEVQGGRSEDLVTSEHFLENRYGAQSALLRRHDSERKPLASIGQDVDNEYSIPYFMIDYLLLVEVWKVSR
ncbi:hypothetical protein SAMN04488564_11197 [Lentzea waywayandensis]|uniref:Uncharacterized protein n=1 Tax=Lentzea waywayandensis TaxID=84724 RepID=A0A1I6FCH1_9PSEU|nr:hypothetical protein [Lentzea waywayandensis]SFR27543.1 hypothetical protein SAMN04488564_11197 [Lentzea waywayandensis]